MTSVVVPLDNTDNTVTRLVAKTIIEKLLFSTEIDEDMQILYIPRGGVAAQSQIQSGEKVLKLDVDNYIKVEYSEKPDPAEFDYNKYQFEHSPFFYAKALGIKVTPLHMRVNLELSLTYRCKSYNALTRWLNTFKRRNLRETPDAYSDVVYNYTLPNDVLIYLTQVYNLSESIAGYGLTLKQFLQNNIIQEGVLVRQNMDNSAQALVINIRNTGVLGTFVELPSDTQDTTKEPPISEVKFTYLVVYDRPTAVILEYQKYIHNQEIDLSFITKYADRRLHTDLHAGNKTFSQAVNVVTENLYGIGAYSGNVTNTTDGWQPQLTPKYMHQKVLIPIQLDLTNLYDILNMNELFTVGYPNWLIDLIHQNSSKLFILYGWIIYIEVYEVNEKVIKIPLSLDESFILKSQIELNPRNRYYVRVLMNTDLFQVDFTELQKQPALLLQLLQWVNPKVTLETIGNGTYVPYSSIRKALNLIRNANITPFRIRTVSNNNIIIRK